MRKWSVVAVLLLIGAVAVFKGTKSIAQIKSAQQNPEFEVASIRPSKLGSRDWGWEFLNPSGNRAPKSGLFSANTLFVTYLMFAYDIHDSNEATAIANNLPAWVTASNWDIEARAEGIPTRAQMRLMMQMLLKTRFKLMVHFENRKQPVYALKLVKQGSLGPALKPHTSQKSCSTGSNMALSNEKEPLFCGGLGWPANGQMHFAISDVSMDEAVSFLGGHYMSDRRLVNWTGLNGRYDIHFAYVQGSPQSGENWMEFARTRRLEEIEKQLGLKFVQATADVPTLVVDHIEKPSAN